MRGCRDYKNRTHAQPVAFEFMHKPTLIYCANGNAAFAKIAIDAGFVYGAQLPGTTYYPVEFADQDWKRPNRERYMTALAKHRPTYATVLDLERHDQLGEVLSWAGEAARHVDYVIIIPKAMGIIDAIPDTINGAQIILGYSVPSRFSGTSVPIWEFGDRPVHLLGGLPHAQMRLAHYLNVISADGNVSKKMAMRCQYWSEAKGPRGHYVGPPEMDLTEYTNNAHLEAWRRSCLNIMSAWEKLTT